VTHDREPGAWPRDRRVRWRALGSNLTTFAITTTAFVVQFALVVGVIALRSDLGGGWLRPAIALAWGLGTLWCAWCWITWRPIAIVMPVATAALIWLASSLG
jgi:hypothetical protein